jgi:hypothetical protein
MNVFSTALNTVASSYREAYRASVPGQIITAGQAAKSGDKVFTLNFSGIRRAAPSVIKRSAPLAAKRLAKNFAVTLLALEVVDLGENEWEKRKRRREMRELIERAVTEGMNDEIFYRLQVLSRADERRTFTQFAKDLPSRTCRRLYRGVLVEAGWWYTVATGIIWAPLVVVDLAFSVVVVPIAALVSKSVFRHELNVESVVNFPRPVVRWVMGKTFNRGMSIFSKGASMRMYNKTKDKANTDYYVEFDSAAALVYKDLPAVKTGPEAYEFGARLAEIIHERELNTEDLQGIYAQVTYWIREKFAVNFANAVQQGFYAGTPVLDRDQVQVVMV